MKHQIDPVFIAHVADVLGETHKGLSGSEITKKCRAYALRYDVQIPYPTTVSDAPNKRTALRENLQAFSGNEQFQIIKELCEDPDTSLEQDERVRKLKIQLITKYAGFRPEGEASDLNETLVEETQHWLKGEAWFNIHITVPKGSEERLTMATYSYLVQLVEAILNSKTRLFRFVFSCHVRLEQDFTSGALFLRMNAVEARRLLGKNPQEAVDTVERRLRSGPFEEDGGERPKIEQGAHELIPTASHDRRGTPFVLVAVAERAQGLQIKGIREP